MSLSSKQPLIQHYTVDLEKGQVTLVMPNIVGELAESVRTEIDTLSDARDKAIFTFVNNSDGITITIQSNDFSTLALNVAKLITRRIIDLSVLPPNNEIRYASPETVRALIGILQEKASPKLQMVLEQVITLTQNSERRL